MKIKEFLEKVNSSGIAKRWIRNILSVVILVFALFFIASSVFIKTYYYNSVSSFVASGSSSAVTNYFNLYATDEIGSFQKGAQNFVENYSYMNRVEIWVINSSGSVVASSSGFEIPEQEMKDYQKAIASGDNFGKWIGKLPSGEKVMTYTAIIPETTQGQTGAVRFIASLEDVDAQIAKLILLVFLALFVLFSVVVVPNIIFLRSIITPVKKVANSAKVIASGDYTVKLEKMYDDEVGSLCESINNMSADIAAADTMKNDFISTISHELRTPLTSIKGWGETLIIDPIADPTLTHKGLQVIINEAGRLGSFVEDLLDFSRMESGRLSLRLEIIDILAELDETVFVFKERAMREGIEIHYNAPDIPASAKADSNRIKQVFVNILDNALKYSAENGKINVTAQLLEDKIKIEVADNGCGISKVDLPLIKKKFYKANISVKGSGIGLAVADEIVQMHGGTLDVDSVISEGTTVTMTFPLHNMAEKEVENE